MPDPNVTEALGQLAAARQELRSARSVLFWVTGLLAFLAFAPPLPIPIPPDLLSRSIVVLSSVTLGHQAVWWWEAREAEVLNIKASASTQRPDAT